MKAEHRHQLQTNVLADRMGRVLQGIKDGPKSTSTMTWIFVLLALGTFAVWKYYANARYVERSSLWVAIDRADSTPDATAMLQQFQEIAEEHHGTIPARVARFQLARVVLADGLQNLASDQRPKAVENVVKAREIYQKLAHECTDAPLLAQEALLGVAKSEEALIGVPNANDPGQNYGTLEQAVSYYQQLVDKYPTSIQARVAEERIGALQKQGGTGDDLSVPQFYAKLQELAAAGTKPPPLPPLPEAKPDAKTEPKAEPKPESKAEPKSESKAEPKSEAKPKAEPPAPAPASKKEEPKSEGKTPPQSEPKSEAKPDAKSETKPKTP